MDSQEKPFSRSDDLRQMEPYSGFLTLCKSPHTQSNYHQDLRALKQFLDETHLESPIQVEPRDLARFAGQLAKPGHTPAGKLRMAYSTRSMKRILASTRSFYRYLASIRLIQNDPTAVFHNLSIRSPQRNPHPLPPQARGQLVKHLKTQDREDFKISLTVLLGYHCGLRVSEICHLRLRDVDLTQKMVTVIGKGDKERSVPLTDVLLDHLREFMAQSKSQSEGPYLFPSPRTSSRPINPHFLELWVKKAAQWAGLEHPEELTVHVLRHTFGTQLAECGASVYEIRDLMGHSSIVVSENYVKLASGQGRMAHRKAFGTGYRSQALNLTQEHGFAKVLRVFRARLRKGWKKDQNER